MDARDLAEKIKDGWIELYPKSSGDIHKSLKPIPVIVDTSEGYRAVVGVVVEKAGHVRLVLDNE